MLVQIVTHQTATPHEHETAAILTMRKFVVGKLQLSCEDDNQANPGDSAPRVESTRASISRCTDFPYPVQRNSRVLSRRSSILSHGLYTAQTGTSTRSTSYPSPSLQLATVAPTMQHAQDQEMETAYDANPHNGALIRCTQVVLCIGRGSAPYRRASIRSLRCSGSKELIHMLQNGSWSS
ncbi:hypothetical protein EI94DRAFT_813584 [Lactarius quietus]|nr:hypothetical protein EI94DRAFT_813584 [Lactarius quietus]